MYQLAKLRLLILAIASVFVTGGDTIAQTRQATIDRGTYKPPLLVEGQVIEDYEEVVDGDIDQVDYESIIEVGPEYFDDLGGESSCDSCSACDGPGCSRPCCTPRFGCCLPTHRMFGSMEYLLWWRRGQTLPPLINSSATDTATPATRLFGGADEGDEATSGGRVTLGIWDPSRCNSLVVRFWSPGEQTTGFFANEGTAAVVGIPFFNADQNQDDTFLIARAADSIIGSVNVQSRSEIYGGDVFLRRRWRHALGGEAEVFWGYQTTRINEDISLNIDSTITTTNNRVQVSDTFDTKNEYHAATIGFDSVYREGSWSLRLLTKIGFGNLERKFTIRGTTTTSNGANNVATSDQGFFARSTNSGTFSSSKFAVSPEVAVTLGYHLRSGLDFTMGYNYLMLSNVIQPWQLIDTTTSDINTNPTLRPAFQGGDDDYWLQGIQFGFAWRY